MQVMGGAYSEYAWSKANMDAQAIKDGRFCLHAPNVTKERGRWWS